MNLSNKTDKPHAHLITYFEPQERWSVSFEMMIDQAFGRASPQVAFEFEDDYTSAQE